MGESEISDSVHARPEAVGLHMQIIPAQFDTIIIHQDRPNGPSNNKGMYLIDKTGHLTNHYIDVCIAQVCIVFQIPKQAILNVALSLGTSTHLAYVEWFSPLTAAPDLKHCMYKVTRLMKNGQRSTGVIHVDSIFGSVHLFP